jgi:ribosomal protein S27E
MRRDSGGWASRGTKAHVQCPKCSNDDSTLIESVIYGKTTRTLFCAVCSHDWPEHEAEDDDRD